MNSAPRKSTLAAQITGLVSAAILAGCVSYSDSDGPEQSAAQTAPPQAAAIEKAPFYVRASMQDHINPAIMSIWDISNNAMDETGGIDGAQVDDAGWKQVADAAAALEAEAERMAAAGTYSAAAPDNMVTGEYEITMEQVQGFLDKDPALFRIMSKGFAAHAKKLGAAAMAKDAALTGDLVAETDAVCASCHAQFWYGEGA